MADLQTKQQQRAKYALTKILDCKKSLKEVDKFHDFANFIVGMPNMILSNGLGQTMAFLLSKKDKQKETFNIIMDWLSKEKDYLNEDFKPVEFLVKFNSISQTQYLDAQQETLRLVEWLKRYARAFDEK